ncbi:hypothetical protein Scep_002356 [Stephania cephalantha]|uniref:Uncharacterized protein n=1 Tax=Stephania cephalantha TaxID=152367 RepID=A0AAP0LAV5_9MAGN
MAFNGGLQSKIHLNPSCRRASSKSRRLVHCCCLVRDRSARQRATSPLLHVVHRTAAVTAAAAASLSGTGGGDRAGSSRPISSPYELVELLQRDFQAMQTHILRVMQDHTLTQDQLREVQGKLNRIERALMDRLGISFAPAPPRDVPADDSESEDDLDD